MVRSTSENIPEEEEKSAHKNDRRRRQKVKPVPRRSERVGEKKRRSATPEWMDTTCQAGHATDLTTGKSKTDTRYGVKGTIMQVKLQKPKTLHGVRGGLAG